MRMPCALRHAAPVTQTGINLFPHFFLLQAVTSKFNRHLSLIKPILNVLLEETVSNPSDTMLRRILVLKIAG
jgi:hypothetical protein